MTIKKRAENLKVQVQKDQIKNIRKVFIVHLWKQKTLQQEVFLVLNKDERYKYVNMSYTTSNPIEGKLVEFVQDYACGSIMDSNFILVLPDVDSESCNNNEFLGDSLLPKGTSNFRFNREFNRDSVYTQELQTIVYDAIPNIPVVILNWTLQNANHLRKLLIDAELYRNQWGDRMTRYYIAGILYPDWEKKLIKTIDDALSGNCQISCEEDYFDEYL